MINTPSDKIDIVTTLVSEYKKRNLNEANTRHQILDVLMHEVFSWPRNMTQCEEHVNSGYMDYVLSTPSEVAYLTIEAKKEGKYFEIPPTFNENQSFSFIKHKQLISDENIKAAMQQVRNYCMDTGCEYACITNGHEWILFKAFSKGTSWNSLNAFVIRNLNFFLNDYTKSQQIFNYTCITERASLPSLLNTNEGENREIYYPKEKIKAFSHSINANKLAVKLRPIISKYFGIINDNDSEFMEQCYVSHREFKNTFGDLQNVIHDSLTPYLEMYGVEQLEDNEKGGRFGGRITKNIRGKNPSEVVVLFGGKGAGKSTFLKRLLHHNPPKWLEDHAIPCIVDLLNTPEEKPAIREKIWQDIIEQTDCDNVLQRDRDELIKHLFLEQYELAKKQELFGIDESSNQYTQLLNALVKDWKKNLKTCSESLINYWKRRHKGVVIIIDNTDQYNSEIQDYCFTTAQNISQTLGCLVVISMREERFHNSKVHGLLDAFQNSGFHISSPNPNDVFKRRLDYVIKLLNDSDRRMALIGDMSEDDKKPYVKYLDILRRQFIQHHSLLAEFLSACTHGDTRMALDLFRSFSLSGYTNVEEMISAGDWTFQMHQVIKPVMIPTRYFYDESKSLIPNIYKLRTSKSSSHFTALRILTKISNNFEVSSPPYYQVATLRSWFSEKFNMLGDFEANLDILLKHGFIEANNRIDEFSEDVDQIRITNYGIYTLQNLAVDFTYLDLVSIDSGVYNEECCNYIIQESRKEYNLFTQSKRYERVLVRLDRVNRFIKYLEEEEQSEVDKYHIDIAKTDLFSYKAREVFNRESTRIKQSAKRYA